MSEFDKIKEAVEQKLQKQQAGKEFKDVGRVSSTRKEKSAFKLISGQLLSSLEEDSVMAFNMVKKENVWPEIDVNSERERGVTSGSAYLKVKIRESVPTRPKDDKSKRATYVLFLEMVQKDLIECYNVEQISELVNKYRQLPFDKIIGYFVNPDFLTASDEQKKLIQSELSLKMRSVFMFSGAGIVPKLINEVFGSRFENTLFNRSDSARVIWNEAKLKEPISQEKSQELIEKLAKGKEQFIQSNNEHIASTQKKTEKELVDDMNQRWTISPENKKRYKENIEDFRSWAIGFYERRIRIGLQEFAEKEKKAQPRDNDWSWFETPKVREVSKPKQQAINTKTPLSYIKRTGGYQIESNTPLEVSQKFGFSAVNYGVYVNDAWSKDHTKHFLGAMSDMGEMLDLNIKQVNELGKLAIAFGAKGRKGHAAAYFPQTKDINLTRGNGDGSVAHEWGHYFDNVIIELDQKLATNNFASEGRSTDPEIKRLFNELMEFLYKGNDLYTPRIPFNFYAQKSETPPAYSKRVNGNWTNVQIEIKDTIEETLEQYKDLAIVSQDLHRTQLRVFGYIIDAFGFEQYEVPFKLKTSYQFHKSAYSDFIYCLKTDKGIVIGANPRTKYWTSAVELFARLWETVILKKLLNKNRVSNYLVADIPMDDIISENWNAPYPSGKELEYLETMVDKIVSAVKNRFNISGFVAPSNIREDQYIELEKKSGKTDKAVIIDNEENSGGKEIKFVEKEEVVKVVDEVIPTAQEPVDESQEIKDTIAGLELILDDATDQEKQDMIDTIEGLKLLL